jgi:hypothetical protein
MLGSGHLCWDQATCAPSGATYRRGGRGGTIVAFSIGKGLPRIVDSEKWKAWDVRSGNHLG